MLIHVHSIERKDVVPLGAVPNKFLFPTGTFIDKSKHICHWICLIHAHSIERKDVVPLGTFPNQSLFLFDTFPQ